MIGIPHNPINISAPDGGYSHAILVENCRYFFISGQIPERLNKQVPNTFEEQCELVWNNIAEILKSAGMSVKNLVKVTTFLTDRSQSAANGRIRRKHLGSIEPALTVVIVQTLESKWLLEIEAIAAMKEKKA